MEGDVNESLWGRPSSRRFIQLLLPPHTANPLQALQHSTNPGTAPAHCSLNSSPSTYTHVTSGVTRSCSSLSAMFEVSNWINETP